MSQIQVKVGAPDLPVPSTDAPDTGVFTGTAIAQQTTQGGEAVPMINMAVALVIPLIITTIAIIIAIRKKKFSNFTVFNKTKTIMGLLFIAVLSTATTAGIINHINENNKQALALVETSDSDATLTVEAEDVNIDIVLEDEAVYKHVPANVVVKNATNTGYTLKVYADSSDLVSKDNEKITGVSQEALDILGDNTWGIALKQPTNENSKVFQGLPTEVDDAITLKETRKATPANDITTVYYGVYVTPDLPFGTYTGPTINYVAVANVVEPDIMIDFASRGLLFEDGSSTNSVGYAYYCTEEAGYVGEDYEEFNVNASNDEPIKVITIEGADNLKVVVDYKNVDALYIVEGNILEDLEDGNEFIDGSIVYEEGTGQKTYTINGNVVTLVADYAYDNGNGNGQFDEKGVQFNDNYAKFKVYPVYNSEREGTTYEELPNVCKWAVVQGEYKSPLTGDYQELLGWILEEVDTGDAENTSLFQEDLILDMTGVMDSSEIDMDEVVGRYILTALNMTTATGSDLPTHVYLGANWSYYHLIIYDGAGAKAPVCVKKDRWGDDCIEVEWRDKLTYKVRLGGNPDYGESGSANIGWYDEPVGLIYDEENEEWQWDNSGSARWSVPEEITTQVDYMYVLDPEYKGVLLVDGMGMDLPEEVYGEQLDVYDVDRLGETTFYVVWVAAGESGGVTDS